MSQNYSQNCEQGVINSLFGDKGKLLDIGAHDGKLFSNTLRLYERGFSGVLVEPSPKAFAGLERQYAGSERAQLVNAAIADHDGEIDLYDSGGDAISSTNIAHKEKWEKGYKCKFTKISVPCMTFATLMDQYGDDYGFVNIDTESTNLQVLKMFPFTRCHPMAMCIEHDSVINEMMKIFAPYEYRIVYTSGENIVVYRGE